MPNIENQEEIISDGMSKRQIPRKTVLLWIAILVFSFLGGIAVAIALLWYMKPAPGKTAHVEFIQSESKPRQEAIEEPLPRTEQTSSTVDADTLLAAAFSAREMLAKLPSSDEPTLEERRRHINIAIVGVDSRIGERSKRADGNHLLSIDTHNGIVRIYSVPRDTYADAGFEEDSLLRFNILANSYAKGKRHYLGELAAITGVPSIHYYVEIGFSQATGILELLGYKQPKETLQMLRSRKSLGGDDFQRAYNQGQFIRQSVLRFFPEINTPVGSALLRSLLYLVRTNLSFDQAWDIVASLDAVGFPSSREAITVALRPYNIPSLKKYNFTDTSVVNSLIAQVEATAEKERSKFFSDEKDLTPVPPSDAQSKLHKLIRYAQADSANSRKVISHLQVPFEQRAWLQVQDSSARHTLRSWFGYLLSQAYQTQGKSKEAAEVLNVIAAEEEVFGAAEMLRKAAAKRPRLPKSPPHKNLPQDTPPADSTANSISEQNELVEKQISADSVRRQD